MTMIYRLSQKLGKKIKETPDRKFPQHTNPYLDWSGHLFLAGRVQYILLMNTVSQYSMVLGGRGITDFKSFILSINSTMADYLHEDGFGLIFEQMIAPHLSTAVFSKALDRSVTGHINDFVFHAQVHLENGERSPFETSQRLNIIPLLKKEFSNAREGFQAMAV